MSRAPARSVFADRLWKRARAGDFRATADAACGALALRKVRNAATRSDLHLVVAFCSMRQGHHAIALRELESARSAASRCPVAFRARALLRVDAWRAELAYYQGRYSESTRLVDRLLPDLETARDWAYVAFALRIRIAVLLARAEHDKALAVADRAIGAAEESGDDYVRVQILNVLGAVHFDRATTKLDEPHARAHLSALDPKDAAPMEADAQEALRLFQRAYLAAKRANHEFAAWYVAGNIERLEILLGRAERVIRPIRKRLARLQARGAGYDEIVARSNLAWALRTLGQYEEASHELEVALKIARETGTANVLLEFLEYDRSIVLDALGDSAGARASHRRYLQLVGNRNGAPAGPQRRDRRAPHKRPLEPYYLKRADRYITEHLADSFSLSQLAAHCGVSWRTIEKAFSEFRGLTTVAHVRNLRLERAHRELVDDGAPVAAVAQRHGFRSPTTFALEYRKRFGMPPSHARRTTRP
jgi:AraC-like DNA-binding protein